MSHTKEPWRFAWQNNDELQMSFACVVIGENIVTIGHGAEKEANARRIAACVNACAGIPTENLENGCFTIEVYDQMCKQRDELMAACEGILPFIAKSSAKEGGAFKYSEAVRAADAVREAIAKVKP